MDRAEHCSFAKLDKDGKCIACCTKNKLMTGYFTDCIDIRSETIKEYCERLVESRKCH